jgi:hypothetical protein
MYVVQELNDWLLEYKKWVSIGQMAKV